MTRLKALMICAMLALCGLAAESRAAALIVVGGELQGATGVNVGGMFYDVELLDGTCAALFTGCDNAADDFAFATLATATVAAQALLDKVFVDGPSGQFDSEPDLTRGCSIASGCYAIVPYALNSGGFNGAFPFNAAPSNPDMVSFDPVIFTTVQDSGGHPNFYFARFTAAPIAEPATMALFGVGLAGMALARRRRAGGKPRHG